MTDKAAIEFSEREALLFHSFGRPGKIEIIASKPMATQRDLALAYSPGVAVPVQAIADDAAKAYDYTAKGNLVAVISNGTAILGMGNLGALASKPVMEGKAVLFKRFADVDAIDLELNTEDPQAFIDAVALLEPSFGGINLEDIKAPECFMIEAALKERMNIPVMHDDQHGTAIICAAGLINACFLTGRDIRETKVVVNGAGAAAIACTELIKAMGVAHDNVIMCDREGVIYQGRTHGMDQFKSAHAARTEARTLHEALKDADIFLGLSAKDALKPEWINEMKPRPILFAMANPDPEILPPVAKAARPDAIIATGRSDYPNQVNNVLGFPFIFRGALDVRATAINEAMKIAAAQAIAELARQQVPEEVALAYGTKHSFGADYIIPAPFDPRLMEVVPAAVAQAAMESGVAQRPIEDMDAYRQSLRARLNPTTSVLTLAYEGAKASPKRVVFAEAEEEVVLRAAIQFRDGGYGTPVLVGRQDVYDRLRDLGVRDPESYELYNSVNSPLVPRMVDMLYERLQRRGYLRRDCERMVNRDRNIFGALLLQMGEADAMITGVTRTYAQTMRELRRVLDPAEDRTLFGMHILVGRSHTVFMADTTVNERPNSAELAHIAIESAALARRMGHEPRVAFLSYSTFGNPHGNWLDNIRGAVQILDGMEVDFEYEGEMAPDVALNRRVMANYPFCRLSGPANVLIMPGLQSANLSAKLLRELGGDSVIGPVLLGLNQPVQVATMASTASELVTLAVLAAGGIAR
ncbi:malate dehydrogenase (oxaloacetate-decarboxylating)(NADP+) [Sphingobium sp. B2D3A]|uniref:NADP-dependent malic enzyme n=1 Tax=Sphingobium TaxID=165695 RepID=UPI0015EC69F1|nr:MULTISPECIES: NADP-dependent malic enzyme [Sphingobium]MCW2336028.1 malate dehydrogenase (oxaloacetate-decarboxylating)(NADP+) [Sphingobium sp. B2D3A]MCW2351659.1 malate dehydrogenase (oxaloacetate-decarboxylating)(NADP+) [Sphingobium sp. B12D2B]MCW2363883.1 malate dehydrogenase (oxaloacetate-decarboxylating)(NADP+) [Sphingobium sp. B10D3B]MCW2365013.1 malate dehydrogenase (oxaloacetate-decarboxylating)(NADP+) [Sphingobium sp. B7D2B]MCW2370925.1 malate dehydrogenase (oxaloacetate-decarboxyl